MFTALNIHKCRYLLKIKILIYENNYSEILKDKKITWAFDLVTDYD